MTLAALPDHLRRPHIRMFQPLMISREGQQLVVLRDPLMLTNQSIAVPPQAIVLIQQLQGERTIEEIAAGLQIKDASGLVELVRRLDDVGLLWGPVFERLEAELKARLFEAGAFPMGVANATAPPPEAVRAELDRWLEQTEDPELEAPPVGIVAPHLDYQRGWPNYASAYRCLEGVEAPDRVVVLGTNHFGLGDGVVLTELDFESPLGRVRADRPVVERLCATLGKGALIDQLDHHAEHSIRLHLPWLQHRFGDVPIVAALVPDPLAPRLGDDGERVGIEPFIAALEEVLGDVGGRTLFVSSADLSHVGPQFGEPRPVDERRRVDVERHDRAMMTSYLTGSPEEFLSRHRETRNPTRWCSIGNMYAALRLARPGGVELIDYRQACDDQGLCLVSSAAIALMPSE